MWLFNQFSYVLLSLGLILALVTALRWRRVRWSLSLAAGFALALLLSGGWLALRPGASDVDSVRAAELTLENGRPTLLEFFSNYCLGCVTVRPEVDALAGEIQDRYNIMRVDIHTDLGRALRQKHGFSYSPEFVLFDVQGREVWRGNRPPLSEQLALALP